jgi:hypothetical protein
VSADQRSRDGCASLPPWELQRMQAADLFERDMSPAEIARQVGVSHQIV